MNLRKLNMLWTPDGKSGVKYSERGHLYSASSRTRLYCATASRKSALISARQSI